MVLGWNDFPELFQLLERVGNRGICTGSSGGLHKSSSSDTVFIKDFPEGVGIKEFDKTGIFSEDMEFFEGKETWKNKEAKELV